MADKRKGSRGQLVVAANKLIKGLALLAVAIGALKLLHKDVAAEFAQWIDILRVDPHNHYIQKLLDKLGMVDDKKLKALSVGTFFYSALFLTEGIGLSLRQRWAEYLTIVSTASLLPLEVYEIVKHVDVARIVVLLANIAIVVYLVIEVRKKTNS